MNRDELAYNAIKSAMDTLDCIDEMINSQSTALQEVDYKISDYLHYIENNDIEDKECVKIVQELKELRQIRRSLKKEYEIEKTYKENSGKVMGNNTRGMLMAEINKTMRQLESEYKYRVINEDEIREKIKCEKKKVGRPKKEVEGEIE